jgi:hypothetical protein
LSFIAPLGLSLEFSAASFIIADSARIMAVRSVSGRVGVGGSARAAVERKGGAATTSALRVPGAPW